MRTDTVFVAGDIRYDDLVEKRGHATQFGPKLVVTDFGGNDHFTSMSITTEPTGGHNCADEVCPGYSEKVHFKDSFTLGYWER